MEIGPFECKGVVVSEECEELVEALLNNKLRCSVCGNNRFIVEAIVEARFVIVGGDVPIVCPEGENKINITNVVRCSKKACGSVEFIKQNE